MRLLACACARSRWSNITHEFFRSAVEIAERRADGLAARKDLGSVRIYLDDPFDGVYEASEADLAAEATNESFPAHAAAKAIYYLDDPFDGVYEASEADLAAEATNESFPAHAAAKAISYFSGDAASLVREIYGNPIRSVRQVTGSLQGLTRRLRDFARKIYDDHRFGDLPLLADLLVEEGCRDGELVAHLRSPGPHFRGCWALDAILGRDAGCDLLTPEEWVGEASPFYMLTWWEYLRGEASSRKRRLIACARCRVIWPLFQDRSLRHAVEIAEAFADGLANEADLAQASEISAAFGVAANRDFQQTRTSSPRFAAIVASCRVAHAAASATGPDHRLPGIARHYAAWGETVPLYEDAGQADLIREILGNPARQVALDPTWLRRNDEAARKLAQAIYNERLFERMPILADALEDAGCSDAEILNHCREPGPHFRGCWLLDLVLGKE
jgi:hypothetical protein